MKFFGIALAGLVYASAAQAGDQPVFVAPIIQKGGPDVVYYLGAVPTDGVAVAENDGLVRAEIFATGIPAVAESGAVASQPSGQAAIPGASISQRDSSALYSRLLKEAEARGLK